VDNRLDTALGRTSADIAASTGMVGVKDPAADGGGNNYGVNFYAADEVDMGPYHGDNEEDFDDTICGWPFSFCSNRNAYETLLAPTSVQKIEPKVFFANERTYLHWLHYAVILSSISSGILAFSRKSGSSWHLCTAYILVACGSHQDSHPWAMG
jgi:hypothetical protein